MIYLNTSCPTIQLNPINISFRLFFHFFLYLFWRKFHLTVSFYIEIYIDTMILQKLGNPLCSSCRQGIIVIVTTHFVRKTVKPQFRKIISVHFINKPLQALNGFFS